MSYSRFIDYIEILKKAEVNNQKPLNVVYCFDNNYSLGAAVSLTSLLKNTPNTPVVAHLFVLNLTAANKANYQTLANTYPQLKMCLYHVNSRFNVSAANTKTFPISACLRVFVPEILSDHVDTFVYIDCDTLVIDSLADLVGYQPKGILAAVEDYDAKRHLARLALPAENYFNSGVMLIDANAWREHDITAKICTLLAENEYEYPDQDALNQILHSHCDMLPKIYNHQHEISLCEDKTLADHGNAKLLHFLGQDKPWFRLFMPTFYREYLALTPWKKQQLKLAPNARRIRVYSKRLKKSHFFKSLRCYLLYLCYKSAK